MNTPGGLDGQMSEALRNMAAHRAASHAVDRRGWTSQQWADDAKRLMSDLDGSVSSLLNGHVMGLIAECNRLRVAVDAALALHQPEKRYHDGSAEWSTDDPREIAEEHDYPLDDVPFFEVCAHCGEIEMSQSDHASYLESMWPCATARALGAAAANSTEENQ